MASVSIISYSMSLYTNEALSFKLALIKLSYVLIFITPVEKFTN